MHRVSATSVSHMSIQAQTSGKLCKIWLLQIELRGFLVFPWLLSLIGGTATFPTACHVHGPGFAAAVHCAGSPLSRDLDSAGQRGDRTEPSDDNGELDSHK
jgi:hypothetical protein